MKKTNMNNITINIDDKLKSDFKKYCEENDTTITLFIMKKIKRAIRDSKNKLKKEQE